MTNKPSLTRFFLFLFFVGHLTTAGLLAIEKTFVFSSSQAIAQELPSPAEETMKDNPKKKPKRARKYLNLALGVDHDEKLQVALKQPKTKGDFKRIVVVEYSP